MCNFTYKMSSPSTPTLKAETLSRKGLAEASQEQGRLGDQSPGPLSQAEALPTL